MTRIRDKLTESIFSFILKAYNNEYIVQSTSAQKGE